ncbi:TPA: hypothetical protein ACH3X3_011004 [Trebouxia sp. C0006]
MTSALRLLLAVQASLLLSGTLGTPGAVQAGRHLLAAAATPPSSIINTILAAGKGFNSFGQTTPQALPAPASAFSLPTTTTTMPSSSGDATCSLPVAPWECRFTLNTGKYTQTGAHADLWCGPGMAKIALKHYFSDPSTQKEVYTGGMPSFEAVDGSGIAVMSKVLGTDPAPARSGDGGFGSVGDVLLKTSKATGVFSDVTHMIRNNELGGMLAPGMTPLAASSASLENFSPNGAEGAPNSAMFVPYQADYYFLSTDTAPANYPTYRATSGSSGSSGAAAATSG